MGIKQICYDEVLRKLLERETQFRLFWGRTILIKYPSPLSGEWYCFIMSKSSESLPTPAAKRAGEILERLKHTDIQRAPDYRSFVRMAIEDVQFVVRETNATGGRSKELEGYLKSFAVAVKEIIATPGVEGDILSVLPANREKMYELTTDALHVHLIGFFRANNLNVRGSIFDPDLPHTDAEGVRIRRHYVQEFISTLEEHAFVIDDDPEGLLGSTKNAALATTNLATRYSPQFSCEFFHGDYIKNIINAGVSEESRISDEIIRDTFTAYNRVYIAGGVANVERAIRKAGDHLRLMTDGWLLEKLNEKPRTQKDLWTLEQVRDSFSSSIRGRLAIKNREGKLETAIERVRDSARRITDSWILTTVNNGIAEKNRWTPDDVTTIFTPNLRMRMALDYKNPVDAINMIRTNLQTLSNVWIKDKMNTGVPAERQWSDEDIVTFFSQPQKRYIAVNYKKPLDAIDLIRGNVEIMTDDYMLEKINSAIPSPKDWWTPEDVKSIFTKSYRRRIAVHWQDPGEAILLMINNLKTMTPQWLFETVNKLSENNAQWTEQEVSRAFSPNTLRFIAATYKEPLEGIQSIMETGGTTQGPTGRFQKTLDTKRGGRA